jgi:hypothetical protein
MPETRIDHAKVIRGQPRECKRLRKALLAKRGEVHVLSVLHEHVTLAAGRSRGASPWTVSLPRFPKRTLGRRFIRSECRTCCRSLGAKPLIPPYTAKADNNASPTALLDALLALEDANLGVASDGKSLTLGVDLLKASPEVRDLLRQCNHSLASMLGNTRGRKV